MAHFKQFTFKKFGYLDFAGDLSYQLSQSDYKKFIKIVFVKAGGHIIIDFEEYRLQQDAFFFINAGQYYWFDNNCNGTMLYYSRDFYCVEVHDKEVACDGILFHNVYEIPIIVMDSITSVILQNILQETKAELEYEESNTEEMLRVLLKQIIIKCTRIWKKEHYLDNEKSKPEVEFSREFGQLIEWNYTRLHTVAQYADLLHITPKALNRRISVNNQVTPNDIIKNRIILEAKRLLVHTSLSIKQISYKLGYEDASYFIRFFTKQASMSPQSFRVQYQQE